MRIQGPRQPDVSRSNSTEQKAKSEETKSSHRGDVVDIGSTAKRLEAQTSKVGADIRARLEEVREQLKRGDYAID